MNDFFAALALALVIEGLAYAAFPDAMKRFLASVGAMPVARLRAAALACAAIGLLLLWIVRG